MYKIHNTFFKFSEMNCISNIIRCMGFLNIRHFLLGNEKSGLGEFDT